MFVCLFSVTGDDQISREKFMVIVYIIDDCPIISPYYFGIFWGGPSPLFKSTLHQPHSQAMRRTCVSDAGPGHGNVKQAMKWARVTAVPRQQKKEGGTGVIKLPIWGESNNANV